MLPGTSLTTGQWVRVADPDDPVDCDNSTSDPFRCTNVTSPATISLYFVQQERLKEGWYKCCLPTDCSTATSIIFASLSSKYYHCTTVIDLSVGWAQITDIAVDLPINMKVLPQKYTLHAITIQYNRYLQNATWYYESGNTSTKMTAGICTGQSGYSCTIGNGVLLHKSNESHDYTLTVTWNGEAITSGILSQSNNNGDHVYRFYLHVGDIDRNSVVQRNKYHTIYIRYNI